MNQPYSNNNFCSDHLGVLTFFRDIVVNVDDETSVYPDEIKLFQNYPNPFNPSTTIEYSVPSSSQVELKIYNTLGQLVNTLVNDYKETGEYSAMWNGKDARGNELPSGNYFYRIKMGEYISVKKMTFLK